MRRNPLAPLGMALAVTLISVPRAAAEDAEGLARQAAEIYAREVRGVVTYHTSSESQISSPVFNQKSRTEAFVVQKDGIPVKVVLQSLITDGKPASKSDLEKHEAKTNQNFQGGKGFFKAPYDRRYMDAYTFRMEACTDCPTGSRAIRFSSDVKDDQHGKGIMILDDGLRIREVRYTPNAFPPNVTGGTLTLKRDEVGKGTLGLKSLKVDYQGGMGFVKGSFAMSQRYEGFKRHASVDEALAASDSGKIATP